MQRGRNRVLGLLHNMSEKNIIEGANKMAGKGQITSERLENDK